MTTLFELEMFDRLWPSRDALVLDPVVQDDIAEVIDIASAELPGSPSGDPYRDFRVFEAGVLQAISRLSANPKVLEVLLREYKIDPNML